MQAWHIIIAALPFDRMDFTHSKPPIKDDLIYTFLY